MKQNTIYSYGDKLIILDSLDEPSNQELIYRDGFGFVAKTDGTVLQTLTQQISTTTSNSYIKYEIPLLGFYGDVNVILNSAIAYPTSNTTTTRFLKVNIQVLSPSGVSTIFGQNWSIPPSESSSVPLIVGLSIIGVIILASVIYLTYKCSSKICRASLLKPFTEEEKPNVKVVNASAHVNSDSI